MTKKLVLFVLLLGFYTQVNANNLFVIQSNTKLTINNKNFAKLFIGVPVTIEKDNGLSLNVTIKGFQDGVNIYSTNRKELLIAILENNTKIAKNDRGNIILSGFVLKKSVSKDIEKIWDETQEFYYEMCSVCHAPPQIEHLSMMEWSAIFPSMKVRTTLDEDEASQILRFLKSNAKDGLVKIKH